MDDLNVTTVPGSIVCGELEIDRTMTASPVSKVGLIDPDRTIRSSRLSSGIFAPSPEADIAARLTVRAATAIAMLNVTTRMNRVAM